MPVTTFSAGAKALISPPSTRASSIAVTVTVCGVSQLSGVKTSCPTEVLTCTSFSTRLPLVVRVTSGVILTVTSAAGWLESTTL